jgi:hypothetical protein
MSDIEPEQFRAVGFTAMAIDYPRDELALAMFAAFNGVTVSDLPNAMRYFPNDATRKAWTRVADAAYLSIAQQADDRKDALILEMVAALKPYVIDSDRICGVLARAEAAGFEAPAFDHQQKGR